MYGPEYPLSHTACLLYWTPPPGNYAIISPWVAEDNQSPLLISNCLIFPETKMFPDGKMKDLALWCKAKKGGAEVGQFNSVLFFDGQLDSEKQLAQPLPPNSASLLFGPLGRTFKHRALVRALRKFDIPEAWLQTTLYEGHPCFQKYVG